METISHADQKASVAATLVQRRAASAARSDPSASGIQCPRTPSVPRNHLPRRAQTGMGIPSCVALTPIAVETSVFTKEAKNVRTRMETISHAVQKASVAATLVQVRAASVARLDLSASGIQCQRTLSVLRKDHPRYARTGMGMNSCAAQIPRAVEISALAKAESIVRTRMETISHAGQKAIAVATRVQVLAANVADAATSVRGIPSQSRRSAGASEPSTSSGAN